MSTLPQVIPLERNAQPAVEARHAEGRIPWTAPVIVLMLRPLLMIAAQAVTALLLKANGAASPWRASGHWWNVYGTLVDLGCFGAILHFTRREGIRLRDLPGRIRLRYGRDIFIGLGYFLLVFPLFLIFGTVFHTMLYRPTDVDPGAYLVGPHVMPLWTVLYSLSVWLLIWSPTEELTYNAFCLPRMRAVCGRTWVAFAVVGFVWAFQHSLLPFVPDMRYMAFRTLAFAPGVFAMMAIYWRTRRLAPLVVAHWPMDIIGTLMCMPH